MWQHQNCLALTWIQSQVFISMTFWWNLILLKTPEYLTPKYYAWVLLISIDRPTSSRWLQMSWQEICAMGYRNMCYGLLGLQSRRHGGCWKQQPPCRLDCNPSFLWMKYDATYRLVRFWWIWTLTMTRGQKPSSFTISVKHVSLFWYYTYL